MLVNKFAALALAVTFFATHARSTTTELFSTNIVNKEYARMLEVLNAGPGTTTFKAGSPDDPTTQWNIVHDSDDNHHSLKNTASDMYVSITESGSIALSNPVVLSFREKFQLEEEAGGFHIKTWSGNYLAGSAGNSLSEVADKSDKTIWYFMDLETAPITESQFIDQVLENAIDHTSTFFSFDTPFSTSPALFAQLMTYNGQDTADLRITEVNTIGFRTQIQEEESLDTETEHAAETFGFMAFNTGNLVSEGGAVIGEVGKLVVPAQTDSFVRTLSFQNSYLNPVVIMMTNSFTGSDPCHIRIVEVTGNGLAYILEEWDYLDGSHAAEEAVYLVVEEGSYIMANGQTLQAMLAYNVDHEPVTVEFASPFSSTPVMLSQMQTFVGSDPSIVRQSNPLPSSVTVKIEEEEAFDNSHKEETVGIITLGI